MRRAPFVFGLRSALSRMSSPGPVRGTMSIKVVPNNFARRAASHSSSFVIRPEARIAICQPTKGFNCAATLSSACFQVAGLQLVFLAHHRLEQPAIALQVIEIEPAVVAHPAGIDGVVFARRLAINHVFARADDGVAAGRATRAKAFRFLQKPDAHFEAEIRRSERADRADIDRVERIIILQPLAGMRGQHGVAAAIDETRGRRRARSLSRNGCSASRGCSARRRA